MKSAPITLLNNIAKNVTSFATLITLTRGDGEKIEFTQHDRPITFNGVYFRNDIPYNLSAIDTNSDLSVDTTTLELAIDGTVFTHRDVGNDVYRGGQIEIALVDWKDLSAGKMILRQGWFTQVQDKRPNILSLEIGGLMKVLDMAIGRTYQPLCDADLGDKRCRVALDPSQAYSPRNPYVQGDWAYIYDRTLMTAVSGSNLDFEAGATPTGWDLSAGSDWTATDSVAPPGQADGTRYLTGGNASAAEQFVAQTFDLVADGVNTADIDAGKIAFTVFALLVQIANLSTSFPRIVVESLDADGAVLATKDTRYITLDTPNAWREKCQHMNLRPGTRSVRVYLYAKTKEGTKASVGFDRVQAYWYDVTAASPTHDVIFKCGRTVDTTQPAYSYGLVNPGFEAATSATSTTEDIQGWTKNGSPWGVTATAFPGNSRPEGQRFLVAGDNGSGIQSTYEITQDAIFTASWADLTRLTQGKYVGAVAGYVSFGDANASAASVTVEFFDKNTVSLGVATVLPFTTSPTITNVRFAGTFSYPVNTSYVTITLKAKSPSGASLAKIGFDSIRLSALDGERGDQTRDLAVGYGDAASTFSFGAGTFSQDGQIVWRAFPTWRLTDTVESVIDRKSFTGTDIVGDYGAYETAKIEWLSGANAGRIGLIRTWFPPLREIKTYFPQLNPINVGDRYVYYPSCQKRFYEDCVFKFNNGINFQGFPYLPGALAPDDNTAPLNTDTAPSPPKPAFFESKTTPVVTASGVVTYPAGMEVGDIMVAVVWNASSDSIPGAPSANWIRVADHTAAVSTNRCAVGVFYKLVTAQDLIAGSATFTNATLNSCMSARTVVKPITVQASILLKEAGANVLGTTYNPMPNVGGLGKYPSLLLAINGVRTGTIHNDTSTLLTPPGQSGVRRLSYPNMMSALVTQRCLDTSQVTAGYVWVPDAAGALRGVRRAGSDSSGIPSLMLALTLAFIGPSEVE